MEGDNAKEKEQATADDDLFQFSTFAPACKEKENKSASSELKLQLMKEVSGIPSSSSKQGNRSHQSIKELADMAQERMLAREREEYKAQIVKQVKENDGIFITKIKFTRDFLAEMVKESMKTPTFHFSKEASEVLQGQLLKRNEVEACRSKGEHGLQVACVFSQEDAFVLQLKVDEKGGWGLLIDETNWQFIRPQIIPPANPGMSIWAFRKPNEGIELLFWLPRWLVDSINFTGKKVTNPKRKLPSLPPKAPAPRTSGDKGSVQ